MAQDVYPPIPEQPVAPGGQCFVQPTQPVGVTGLYLWIETGLGDSGEDVSLWIEDGS
jgi:hypothetical protein